VPPLALWNVDDAQRFVCAIVSRSGLALSWSEREDLEQYLLVECWRLSLRYQPGGPKDFDGWASRILRVRVVDWTRQRNGRTR
jgi:DNA-directed RNA polymerase specialized sigma24 family protein